MQITFRGGKDVKMQVSLQEESEGISRSLHILEDLPHSPFSGLNEGGLLLPLPLPLISQRAA